MRPAIPEDNTKFTAADVQRERVPKNNFSQRVKTRLNNTSGTATEKQIEPYFVIEIFTEAALLRRRKRR